MKVSGRKIAGIAALAGLAISSSANAACWAPHEVQAAKVRDLQTMLMVATLRCQIKGDDLLGSYNRFVRTSRSTLVQANDVLRARFNAEGTGLNGYDRFVTKLANHYGAGGISCDDARDVVKEAARNGESLSALETLSRDAGANAVNVRSCPVNMARSRR